MRTIALAAVLTALLVLPVVGKEEAPPPPTLGVSVRILRTTAPLAGDLPADAWRLLEPEHRDEVVEALGAGAGDEAVVRRTIAGGQEKLSLSLLRRVEYVQDWNSEVGTEPNPIRKTIREGSVVDLVLRPASDGTGLVVSLKAARARVRRPMAKFATKPGVEIQLPELMVKRLTGDVVVPPGGVAVFRLAPDECLVLTADGESAAASLAPGGK